MPMQQNPNNRRRGEERNETLIIPHITKEMVETARRMAERGASRAEIEQAIAAMQAGKTPTEAESAAQKKPIVQPQAAAAPARNTAAHSDTVIIPTSRPRYTSAERRAMLEARIATYTAKLEATTAKLNALMNAGRPEQFDHGMVNLPLKGRIMTDSQLDRWRELSTRVDRYQSTIALAEASLRRRRPGT